MNNQVNNRSEINPIHHKLKTYFINRFNFFKQHCNFFNKFFKFNMREHDFNKCSCRDGLCPL